MNAATLLSKPSVPDRLEPGDLLGAYQLLCPIAQGGMGQIWISRRATEPDSGRLFAIKTALPRIARTYRDVESLFREEARIATAVEHPNVCRTYELGEDRGILFLAMEWIDGASLANLVSELDPSKRRLDFRLAAYVVAQACAGLHALHELTDDKGDRLNPVHRDATPQNILVSSSGDVKVIDFGVVKARGGTRTEEDARELKGKIAYFSPEQLLSKQVDRRTDIFALGCVLYYASTGRRAFGSSSPEATMLRIVQGDYVAPSCVINDYPPSLEAIVLRALADAPMARFQSAADMRKSLETFLGGPDALPACKQELARLLDETLGAAMEDRRNEVRLAQRLFVARSQPMMTSAAPVPTSRSEVVPAAVPVPIRASVPTPPSAFAMPSPTGRAAALGSATQTISTQGLAAQPLAASTSTAQPLAASTSTAQPLAASTSTAQPLAAPTSTAAGSTARSSTAAGSTARTAAVSDGPACVAPASAAPGSDMVPVSAFTPWSCRLARTLDAACRSAFLRRHHTNSPSASGKAEHRPVSGYCRSIPIDERTDPKPREGVHPLSDQCLLHSEYPTQSDYPFPNAFPSDYPSRGSTSVRSDSRSPTDDRTRSEYPVPSDYPIPSEYPVPSDYPVPSNYPVLSDHPRAGDLSLTNQPQNSIESALADRGAALRQCLSDYSSENPSSAEPRVLAHDDSSTDNAFVPDGGTPARDPFLSDTRALRSESSHPAPTSTPNSAGRLQRSRLSTIPEPVLTPALKQIRALHFGVAAAVLLGIGVILAYEFESSSEVARSTVDRPSVTFDDEWHGGSEDVPAKDELGTVAGGAEPACSSNLASPRAALSAGAWTGPNKGTVVGKPYHANPTDPAAASKRSRRTSAQR